MLAEEMVALGQAAEAHGVGFTSLEPPRSATVVVQGLRLHYLDWGRGGQMPMLLLHGGMQQAHSWDFFSLAMRDRFHVIALDQRGHGESEWSPAGDYSWRTQATDTAHFVDTLGLGRMVIIGLSMGGINALVYARNHPDKVAALVLVDVGPKVNRRGTRSLRRLAESTSRELDFDSFLHTAHSFNPRRSREHLAFSLLHSLRRLGSGKWTWKYDPQFTNREKGFQAERDTDHLWRFASELSCPTLVLRGSESEVFLESYARQLCQVIPNSSLVTVDAAGHTVPGDNPKEFQSTVWGWLESLGLGKA